MSDKYEWDGIAKFQYSDGIDGMATYDASDEIHEELLELIEKWRDDVTPTNMGGEEAARNHALMDCADELEEVLTDE